MSTAQTTIQSVIKSKENQEVLVGAMVTNIATNKSVLSNNKGVFSVEGANLDTALKVSYFGFETLTFKANKIPAVIYLNPVLESLNQIVISASRTKEKKHDVPVAISVITKRKIEEMQPNDISEVLNQKPGVLMVDLGNEQHMMAIRQPITTKSVFLYLEDGLPIRPTGIFNHNALLETNSNAVENIEIVRGAYSSLYGSEAIGGAVNFITENPTKDLNVTIGNRINDIGYKRFDAKISGTINEKTGVYVSGYKSSIVDGFRAYGDFDKKVITTKLTQKINEKINLVGSVNYVDYRSDMSGSIGESAFKKRDFSSIHTFTYREAKSLRASATINYKANDFNNSFLKFFYRDNSLEQNPSYRISTRKSPKNAVSKTGELNENSFKSYGALFQQNTVYSDGFKLSFGAVVDYTKNDFYAEELEVFRNAEGVFESFTQLGTFSSDYNAELLNGGLFSSMEYKITNEFRLNGGLRMDAFNYKFKNNLGSSASSFTSPNTANTFWSVTPRLGVVYNKSNHGAYANYSRGFVPPSVGELYKGNVVPDLTPSVFNNFEIGSHISLLNNKIYLDGALYYLRGENEVLSVEQEDGTRLNENAGETEHYGLELLMDYSISSQFKLRVSESFSKHKFIDYVEAGKDYSGNNISGAPQFNGSVNLQYKPNYLNGFHIGIELQNLGSYYSDNQNTIEYKGHNVFNLRTGYKFSKLYVWANLLNVTDKLYATRVSTGFGSTTYTPGTPRNITVGVRYSLK